MSSTGWEQHQEDCSPTSHPYLLPTHTLLPHTSQLLAASSSSAEPCGEFPCPEPQAPEANLRILEPAYQRTTWEEELSPQRPAQTWGWPQSLQTQEYGHARLYWLSSGIWHRCVALGRSWDLPLPSSLGGSSGACESASATPILPSSPSSGAIRGRPHSWRAEGAWNPLWGA